jgi:hypothetical protein
MSNSAVEGFQINFEFASYPYDPNIEDYEDPEALEVKFIIDCWTSGQKSL